MQRETQIKKWNRAWKENLINKVNPQWLDLYEDFKKNLTPTKILELLFNKGIN